MAIAQWALNWDRGTLVVQSLGAMIMPRFDLPDGRSISPLATPPWRSEPPTPGIPQGLQICGANCPACLLVWRSRD
jgi:hypothetical protein